MIVPAAVLRQIHFAGDHDEDEEETTRLELYTVRARRTESSPCACVGPLADAAAASAIVDVRRMPCSRSLRRC